MKRCSKCAEDKPEATFAPDKRRGGLQARCRACAAAYTRAYASRHPDAAKARLAVWRAENREKMATTQRAWQAANAEQQRALKAAYHEANKDRINAEHQAWKKANRAACTAAENKRRVTKLGGVAEQVDTLAVFERDKWTCYLCLEPVDRTAPKYAPLSPVLEHVVPLSRGGGHTYGNVACAHWRCNLRKGSRPWTEFSAMLD